MKKLFSGLGKDVTAEIDCEIQGYLDKIDSLKKDVVLLTMENFDLRAKLAEKPKGKVVKKYE